MIYIYASGSFYQAIEDQLFSLKAEVKASCGKHIRRVDRFTQLALIGAHRCRQDITVEHPCGLYLSSGDGPQTNTIDSLQTTFLDRQPLMPLNFVNMVSNAAAFYVAQSLAVDGANIFVSSPSFALDKALQLAELDLLDGSIRQALVGCVDECAAPLYLQRDLLGLAKDAPVGEGSYWFLVGASADNALAVIRKNLYLPDWQAVQQVLAEHANTDYCFAAGHGLQTEHRSWLQGLTGEFWPYTDALARHNACTGFAVDGFLQQRPEKQLLHIDRSNEGHFSLLLIERLA